MKRYLAVCCLAVLAVSGFTPAYSAETTAVAPAKAEAKHELFTVARLVVAKGVQDKEPVDVSDVLPASTDKAYCFLEAKDISEDTEVEFVWYLGTNEMRATKVNLQKGPRWRVYVNKTINGQRGDWRVDLRDANRTVIKSAAFKVE